MIRVSFLKKLKSGPNDNILITEGLVERTVGWGIGDVPVCPGSRRGSMPLLHLPGDVTLLVKEM